MVLKIILQCVSLIFEKKIVTLWLIEYFAAFGDYGKSVYLQYDQLMTWFQYQVRLSKNV